MIDLKNKRKTIVGMVHVAALPGTPMHHSPMKKIISQSVHDASIYLRCVIDAIMIENMHDVPYLKQKVGPEITAAMTAIAVKIRQLTSLPVGIQILAGANREALSVAMAANLDFIRTEGFVFGHLADEGYIESCAGELLRYRKQIGCENVAIFTDVKKKHASHQITGDVDLAETIRAAEFFMSDGIIITGKATGFEPDLKSVQTARETTLLPILIGSGINSKNLAHFWPYSDAFIVGSEFKADGNWSRPVDEKRVSNFISQVQMLRSENG